MPARYAYVLLVRTLAAAGKARAAHPMLTEDPQTQGTGHFELELGQSFARGDPRLGGLDARRQVALP